jgi:hypothetical protein
MSDRHRPCCVRGSELAQMGICERQIVLDRIYDCPPSRRRRRAMARGVRAHRRFDAEASRPHRRNGRCFIATRVLGEAAQETRVLRRVRDEMLKTHRFGRAAVALYYRHGRRFCGWLDTHKWLCPAVAVVLRAVAMLCGWALATQGQEQRTCRER